MKISKRVSLGTLLLALACATALRPPSRLPRARRPPSLPRKARLRPRSRSGSDRPGRRAGDPARCRGDGSGRSRGGSHRSGRRRRRVRSEPGRLAEDTAAPAPEAAAAAAPAPALGAVGYDSQGRQGRDPLVVRGDTLWDISRRLPRHALGVAVDLEGQRRHRESAPHLSRRPHLDHAQRDAPRVARGGRGAARRPAGGGARARGGASSRAAPAGSDRRARARGAQRAPRQLAGDRRPDHAGAARGRRQHRRARVPDRVCCSARTTTSTSGSARARSRRATSSRSSAPASRSSIPTRAACSATTSTSSAGSRSSETHPETSLAAIRDVRRRDRRRRPRDAARAAAGGDRDAGEPRRRRGQDQLLPEQAHRDGHRRTSST